MPAEFESIVASFFGQVAPSLDTQRTIEVTARERRTGCERLVTFHRRELWGIAAVIAIIVALVGMLMLR